MAMDRRSALRTLAAAGAAVAVGPRKASGTAVGAAGSAESAAAMLYDATRCIGCQVCMVACRRESGLEVEDPEGLWDHPTDLSANARTVVKLYRDREQASFVKKQCMHCLDPACAAACIMGALHKDASGAVVWDGERCVGCRYCEVACPFEVPKFEWTSSNPRIVKCDMCADRRAAGQAPACVATCPREAITYGTRGELIAEAHRRLEAEPETYEAKVYGEHDGGGTQVLYLAAVGFEKLGLPVLGERAVPETVRGVQGMIYKGFAAPLALYAVFGTVISRNIRKEHAAKAAAEAAAGEAVEADEEEVTP